MLHEVLKSESKSEKKKEKPSFQVDFEQFPEAKNWELGKTYTIKIKQVMKDEKYGMAGFEIIGTDNDKDESYE